MHPPESQVPMCCLHDHAEAPQLPLPSTSSHTPLQPPGGNADPTAGPAERAELHGAALPLPGAPALSMAGCGTAATGARVTFAGPGVVFKHIAPHPPPGRIRVCVLTAQVNPPLGESVLGLKVLPLHCR